MGYKEGIPFPLEAEEVEGGHVLRSDLVGQARDAIELGRLCGCTVSISSAFREMKKQQELYRRWKAGDAGFNPADPPGHSGHQKGEDLDLHFGSGEEREKFATLAERFGFSRPIHAEPWHFKVTLLPKGEPNA